MLYIITFLLRAFWCFNGEPKAFKSGFWGIIAETGYGDTKVSGDAGSMTLKIGHVTSGVSGNFRKLMDTILMTKGWSFLRLGGVIG